MDKLFSNIDIVTIAVYLLGGDSKYVDTEDIAVKVNELAPGSEMSRSRLARGLSGL